MFVYHWAASIAIMTAVLIPLPSESGSDSLLRPCACVVFGGNLSTIDTHYPARLRGSGVVMCNQQHCASIVSEVGQHPHDDGCIRFVQITGGFVRKYQPRLMEHRPR